MSATNFHGSNVGPSFRSNAYADVSSGIMSSSTPTNFKGKSAVSMSVDGFKPKIMQHTQARSKVVMMAEGP